MVSQTRNAASKDEGNACSRRRAIGFESAKGAKKRQENRGTKTLANERTQFCISWRPWRSWRFGLLREDEFRADVLGAGFDLERHDDEEGRAFAGRAAEADRAAEERGEFFGDRQAQAGAGVLAGGAAV